MHTASSRAKRIATAVAPLVVLASATGLMFASTAGAVPDTGASASACGSLAIRDTEATGGDSHGGVIVILTNDSAATCSVRGYPTASLLDRSGATIAVAKRTLDGYVAGCSCTHPARVRLNPGDSASTVVEGDNGGGDECFQGHSLLFTPPHSTATTQLPYLDAFTCRVQVHPLVAGTTGGNRQ